MQGPDSSGVTEVQKKLLLFLTAIIIALVTFLILHIFGITETGKRMEFQTISIGAWSGHTNPAYYFIQNANEWEDIWNQHQRIFLPPSPPPEVDFSTMTVIAVFMGQCPTSGYEIEVKGIIDTGLTTVVKVEKTYPGKELGVFPTITYPYHIIKVYKIDKYVIFHTFTRVK